MAGVNKVILVGNLGKDPELRNTTSGTSVCEFSIATGESWKGKDGQMQERTEWHRIIVWGKLGENCAKFLSKGRQVFLEGRLQTRSWEDKDGNKRYTTEIVARDVQFLGTGGGKGAGNDGPPPPSDDFGAAGGGGFGGDSGGDSGGNSGGGGDDIPF